MGAGAYHIDSREGNDRNDGLSPATAWQSFAPVNRLNLEPGDRVMLRAGSSWEGQALHPKGSGAPGAAIQITSYGEGARPALHGRGEVPEVIRLFNQEYWTIEGLEITNRAPDGPKPLRGVLLQARDAGVLRGIQLRNLVVREVNAPYDYEDSDVVAKSYGGIVTLIEGNLRQTAWEGLLVEGCEIRDVSAIGLTMSSSWVRGHRVNDPTTWFPSQNVIIRSNVFERTARNGLIVRACVGAVVERNLFTECGLLGSGNASFAFHSDDTVFQYNEARFTRFNPGDHDAAGFDSDYNCRRTVIQYNYSHHNDYGFVLLCNNGATGFNEDTIVRFNLSYHDGGNVIRLSGPVKGARIYHNTIVTSPEMANPRPGHPPRIVYHKSWSGWSDNTVFFNNLIFNGSAEAVYDAGTSTRNRYSHNLFAGMRPSTEPTDEHAVTGDPLFVDPSVTATDLPSMISAFSLRPGSPALGAGLPQGDLGGRDLAGRPLPGPAERPDIGALAGEVTPQGRIAEDS
jgi:hypothetical protein